MNNYLFILFSKYVLICSFEYFRSRLIWICICIKFKNTNNVYIQNYLVF